MHIYACLCFEFKALKPNLIRTFDGCKFGYFRRLVIEVISNNFWHNSLLIESNNEEMAQNLRTQLAALDCNDLSIDTRISALEAIIDANKKAVPIFECVFDKLKHPTHTKLDSPLRFDHCLALILYTSTPANYNLTTSHLENNYRKWKYFDHCLMEAIARLGARQQIQNCDLWCGLHNVYFHSSMISDDWLFLSSCQSSSFYKSVAENFRNKFGVLIKIDSDSIPMHYRCDVSWISRYESESEVLLARGMRFKITKFEIVIQHKQRIELVAYNL